MKLQNKLGFYFIKIIAIFIMAILYFLSGSILSITVDNNIPIHNIQNISSLQLITYISIIFGIIAIVYYFLRITIKNIPFILNGLYGFNYLLLKEASGGIIFAFIMYSYQDKLKILLIELRDRLTLQYYKFKNKLNL